MEPRKSGILRVDAVPGALGTTIQQNADETLAGPVRAAAEAIDKGVLIERRALGMDVRMSAPPDAGPSRPRSDQCCPGSVASTVLLAGFPRLVA
jgi:hypothetical protein